MLLALESMFLVPSIKCFVRLLFCLQLLYFPPLAYTTPLAFCHPKIEIKRGVLHRKIRNAVRMFCLETVAGNNQCDHVEQILRFSTAKVGVNC
jgi:hypothetical protein